MLSALPNLDQPEPSHPDQTPVRLRGGHTMASYSRLSALDRSFLDIENRNTHMHVGATCVFEAGPLAGPHGGIDIDRIRAYVESRLHLLPRYRQHIAWTPFEGHPVWVDDDQFDIRYHVRHLSLPRPGCERELKRLAGWINSQQLDRGKPLWELWIVEGLEDNRFAVIAKTHHCMIDGLAGADFLAVLLRPDDDATIAESHRWLPRAAPAPSELVRDALVRQMLAPVRAARAIATNPAGFWKNATDLVSALYETGAASVRAGSETPLNRAIGSHRRFDWLTFDLNRVKAVKDKLGGTVNDVVLAVVAGGIRDYLGNRGVSFEPDFVFRAFCPVGLHPGKRGSSGGNFVSAMLAELPLEEPDALRRLARIRKMTQSRKDAAPVRGTEVLESIADEIFPTMLSTFASAIESSRAYNLVCTNVPGPQFPLYLLGAPMIESHPLVPLFGHQGVGIALLSYDGKLCWGFSADRDIVPDLHDLVERVRDAFAELESLAGIATGDSRPKKPANDDTAAARRQHAEPPRHHGTDGDFADLAPLRPNLPG
jgi:diacylglycerol O-acyltransferase / wax synthase